MTKKQSRYIVPNSFTALSMLFGFASIAASAEGSFVIAAWMIVWGVLLDKLDGTAARLLDACSDFGMEFDSFADFVVFGIAPAALVYFRLSEMAIFQGQWHNWMVGGIGLYALATAIRLARFNVSEPPGSNKLFYGIPTTVCGGLIALLYLCWDNQGLGEWVLKGAPILMVVCAVAMISSVRLPKLKPHKRLSLNIIQGTCMLMAYVLAPLMILPEFLLALEISYVGIGLVWAFRRGSDFLDDLEEAELVAERIRD
ncbi:MAG: CDP-diacylglycerol--serine O-phosphatidyltransferase [Myxococcota bacterium]|jgi:CDP-diacylglycerol--serine O-phosphatidyltransferase